jgi:hypothetical protein
VSGGVLRASDDVLCRLLCFDGLPKHVLQALRNAGAIEPDIRPRREGYDDVSVVGAFVYRCDVPTLSRRACPSTLPASTQLIQEHPLLTAHIIDPHAETVALLDDPVLHLALLRIVSAEHPRTPAPLPGRTATRHTLEKPPSVMKEVRLMHLTAIDRHQ